MRHLAGVQSVPRVMRGAPVVNPRMIDVPLSERALAGIESQGLARTLSGLESQGLARTLGSLSGSTLGDEIEMPEECARPGEVLLAPGVCGPDPRKPLNPYATPPVTVPIGVGPRRKPSPAAASAKDVVAGMTTTQILLATVGAVGLLYYLSKSK